MSDDETFYEVLSVDPDADRETIQRAYREQVKAYHPDVSDHPNARERFKRITRAKTVLTDRRERKRYDRLGHEAYLARERSGQTNRDDGDDADPEPSAAYTTDPTADESTADDTDWATSSSEEAGPSQASQTADGASRTQSQERAGPHGDPMTGSDARAATERDADTGPPGRFALREAVSAVPVGIAAGVSVALALVPQRSVLSAGVLLVSWVIVAAVAGRLAAGSAPALPDDVVRAHAFPLVVLVAAWYVALGTDYRLVAGGLAAYGLFAAVFRTAALTSRGGSSALWPSSLWYVATAPGAVVLYVTLTDRPGVLRATLSSLAASTPGPVGSAPVLAVVAAVVVVSGHAVWRLGRVLA